MRKTQNPQKLPKIMAITNSNRKSLKGKKYNLDLSLEKENQSERYNQKFKISLDLKEEE